MCLLNSFFFMSKTHYVYFFLFILHVPVFVAQNRQVDFNIANDKFFLIDRYFTSGIYTSYRHKINGPSIFKKQANHVLQLNVTIGSEIYTPKNTSSSRSFKFDRPYAGWLSLNLELGKIAPQWAWFFTLETGVTGQESLAGKSQIKFHELFNIQSRPTWVDEIAFSWLTNVKYLQVNNFILNKKNEIQNHVNIAFGTKDVYLQNKVYYFFGNFNNFQNSSRLSRTIGSIDKELFYFTSIGYKYVLYNTLIQGNLLDNNAPFTTQITPNIFLFSIGSGLKINKNKFRLELFYNTKETPYSRSHTYGAVAYGFVF